MHDSRLTVIRSGLPLPRAEPGEVVMSDDELRACVLSGRALRSVGRYHTARLMTERLSTSGRPMLGWALRLMARDRCYIVDAEGCERDLTTALLARWSWQLAGEVLGKKGLLRQVTREVQDAEAIARARRAPSWNRNAVPLYLRTDLSF